MDILTIALILGAAGAGGAVGAGAAAVVAGNRAQTAATEFESVFSSYFAGKEDPDSRRVLSAFSMLKQALDGLGGALGRLKRSLKLR